MAIVAVLAFSSGGSAITYGTIDYGHPYVGAIIINSFTSGIHEFCSGTLVSPRVFLTAGHCTDALRSRNFPLDRIWVSFAVKVFEDTKSWRTVDAYITDPDYNWGPTSDPHDIGVLILSKTVKDITPAPIAPVGYLDQLQAAGKLPDATFINVGYGTDENLQPTNTREISYSSFLSLHDAWLYMSQNIHAGSSGTCFGDSGGPTFYDAGTTEYIVATVSWGDAQCVATNINYRADLANGQAFVYSVIAAYA